MITLTVANFKPYSTRESSWSRQPKKYLDIRCSMNYRNSNFNKYADKVDGRVNDTKEYVENGSSW